MPLDFKKLLTARFFYSFGVQMQAVILGWRIYELLKDPLALGLIGLAEAVPAIGLALVAGYLVDRKRPLHLYRYVLVVSIVSGFLVLSELIFRHQLDVYIQASMLYGASFLTGLARAFSGPIIYSSVPRIVSRDQLVRASAISSSIMQSSRIVGPAAGGLFYGFLGPVNASAIICIFLITALVMVLFIKADIKPPQRNLDLSLKEEFLSGIKFVFTHPILFPALSLDMVSVFFGGVTGLLPIFANDILKVGAKGLGILRGAPAIGATIMGIYLSKKPIGRRSGVWLLRVVAGFGLCMIAFGVSKNFYLSVGVLALSGAFDSVSMVIRSSAVQIASPDHMRGKVSSVNSIFIGSSNELGELESGVAAKLLGTIPAVYAGGVVCFCMAFVVGYFSPNLRKMELDKLSS